MDNGDLYEGLLEEKPTITWTEVGVRVEVNEEDGKEEEEEVENVHDC